MRYLIPLLFIGLIAAGIYFVNKTNPIVDDSQENQSKVKDLQQKLDKKLDQEDTTHLPAIEDSHDHSDHHSHDDHHADDYSKSSYEPEEEEMTEYFDDQEMIEDEYSEEVSDDDFNEFLSAAQEEIMDDPEIAEAIIGEMSKIFKVQPDHQQKIIRFYEECAGNAKLPEKIRNLCDKERYSTGN